VTFRSDRLTKLLFIQVMRSPWVRMVAGIKMTPSLALFFAIVSYFEQALLGFENKGELAYTDENVLPVHLSPELLEQNTRRFSDVRAIRDGDESPIPDVRDPILVLECSKSSCTNCRNRSVQTKRQYSRHFGESATPPWPSIQTRLPPYYSQPWRRDYCSAASASHHRGMVASAPTETQQ
jgi:hypothetical protein